MLPDEDIYGFRKRFLFVQNIIEEHSPTKVLDIGCGTGEYLTFPLATHFPEVQFLGVDTDTASIEFARSKNHFTHLAFAYPEEVDLGVRFDLIIASEVIEHVDEPERFLLQLRSRLSEQGKIILTLPNGYGPFEMASVLHNFLYFMGIFRVVRILRSLLGKRQNLTESVPATLAISPHINFFTMREIRKLIEQSGLQVVQFRPRTFLCGFLFDRILRTPSAINWNAEIVDRFPHYLSSDWMFLLQPSEPVAPPVLPYRRRANARFRKYLNEKRWKIQG